SRYFVGADVVVLNDNDSAGHDHSDAVAAKLTGIAKRVRRLDLAKHWSGMPDKADISDWLFGGHTREELDALIATASDWTPAAPRRLIQSSAQFVQGFVPPDYLIDGLLQRRFLYSFNRQDWQRQDRDRVVVCCQRRPRQGDRYAGGHERPGDLFCW